MAKIEKFGRISDRSPHVIADLFEIMALVEGQEKSRGDVETSLDQQADDGLADDLDEDLAPGASSAEVNATYQALTENVFDHFKYRKSVFGEWYPFNVDADVLTPVVPLTDRMKIYIFFLFCSRLAMLSKSDRSRYASHFEKVCVEAIKGLFPTWDIYHFGAGGMNRAQFGNKLKDALSVLSGHLKDSLVVHHHNAISNHDVGDAGIDIIAVHNFGDAATGVVTYFIQCAARQDGWPDKRFEVSNASLSTYFHFECPPGAMLLIPLLYRNPDGKWVDARKPYSVAVLDRLRLTQLIERRQSAAAITAALAHVPVDAFSAHTSPD